MTEASVKAPKTSADIETILRLLPHRFPMLMIDRVLDVETGKRGVAIKNVTANEPHFQGHFPGNPVMPGVLLIEALAQFGGIVVTGVDTPPRVGFLAGINEAKFRRMVRPGDQLRLEVEVLSSRRLFNKIKGVATVDGEVVAEAEILFVFES